MATQIDDHEIERSCNQRSLNWTAMKHDVKMWTVLMKIDPEAQKYDNSTFEAAVHFHRTVHFLWQFIFQDFLFSIVRTVN